MTSILQGRRLHTQQVHFLRYVFSSKEDTFPVYLGSLPENSVIRSIRVAVKTAFAGAKLKFGNTEQCNDMGEADVGAAGVKNCTVPDAKRFIPEGEASIYVKLDKKVDAGEGIIIIDYIPNL